MDPYFPTAHVVLGAAYLEKGMHTEALSELEAEKNIEGGFDKLAEMLIAVTYARMGEANPARHVLDRLLGRSEAEYVPPSVIANIYMALGEMNLCFSFLEKAYDERDLWLCYLKVLPIYEGLNLHSDPRYIELLTKMGLDT